MNVGRGVGGGGGGACDWVADWPGGVGKTRRGSSGNASSPSSLSGDGIVREQVFVAIEPSVFN